MIANKAMLAMVKMRLSKTFAKHNIRFPFTEESDWRFGVAR